MNRDRAGSDDFCRHPPSDVDVVYSHPPKTLNVRLTFDRHLVGPEAPWDLSNQTDCHRILALKIPAQFSFDDRGMASDTRTAEIAFAGQIQIAARANGSAEAGGNFVITKVDVRAATGAISRRGRVTNFMFAFAFKTGDDAIFSTAPDILHLSMKRELLRSAGSLLEL